MHLQFEHLMVNVFYFFFNECDTQTYILIVITVHSTHKVDEDKLWKLWITIRFYEPICCFTLWQYLKGLFSSPPGKKQLTLSTVEFQSQLLTCPCLFCQPLLQLLLLLQQLVYLLVVVEGLPHQLGLGHLGMFKLKRGQKRRGRVKQAKQQGGKSGLSIK